MQQATATIQGRSGWPDEGLDEAFEANGAPKPHYRAVLGDIERVGAGRLAAEVRSRLDDAGVRFGVEEGEIFEVDVVPRLITAPEWKRVSEGLAQRAKALDAYVADVYGERRIFAEGVISERIMDGCEHYEPWLQDTTTPSGHWAHICGFDLVRDGSGELVVLEDNLRTPSGIAYLLAARAAVGDHFAAGTGAVRSLEDAPRLLAEAIRAAAPPGSDRNAAVLTDGPSSVAHYEHTYLARALGLPLARPDQLSVFDGRLWMKADGGREPIDVVYRRTDDDTLTLPGGELNDLTETLGRLMVNGTVAVVNAFGTGVADDKLAQRHVDEMVRFYLRKEPLIASVPTFDLDLEDHRMQALETLGELVVKPRSGQGGSGVVICADETPEKLEQLRSEIGAGDCGLIAQPTVALSTHPTWDGTQLAPRHVDLRVFAFRTADEFELIPGGLSRFASEAGSMIVNSSQGGGAKDTWVMS